MQRPSPKRQVKNAALGEIAFDLGSYPASVASLVCFHFDLFDLAAAVYEMEI